METDKNVRDIADGKYRALFGGCASKLSRKLAPWDRRDFEECLSDVTFSAIVAAREKFREGCGAKFSTFLHTHLQLFLRREICRSWNRRRPVPLTVQFEGAALSGVPISTAAASGTFLPDCSRSPEEQRAVVERLCLLTEESSRTFELLLRVRDFGRLLMAIRKPANRHFRAFSGVAAKKVRKMCEEVRRHSEMLDA